MSDIVIRKCQTLDDFHLCVALQREIWQEADLEIEPVTAFVVATNTGGQVLGAFEGARLVGYTLAVAAIRDGVPYLHSHMAGVHAAFRNRSIGRLLKLAQRNEALSRNLRLICWTFDPLEFRNAYFNLNRLGAICRRYLPDFYGVTSSPLHRGMPTDRLLAEWHLDSPRVMATAAGTPVPIPQTNVLVEMPPGPGNSPSSMLATPLAELLKTQERLRDEFTRYFQRNYAAVAMSRDSTARGYVLCPWSDF
jgi:predicted GNAT superfamily acetyltransferase